MFGRTMFLKALALSAVLLAAPAAGVAAQPANDLRTFHAVAASVDASPHFTIFDDVAVTVEDGVVRLTGKVTSGHKRSEFEEAVAKVAGVRQVINDITLLPASTFDDELRQRIARAIYGNSNFWNYAIMPSPPIHIIVDRSHVTLTGVVQNEVDRRLAQALATQFGALSVTNALQTAAEARRLDSLD
jgi:osmotically-inducible protein OsmY